MRLTMPSKWYQKAVLIVVLLYLLYALLAAVLVATWGRHLLVDQLQQLTGQSASVRRLRFNPFSNHLTLSDAAVSGADGTIISLGHLSADLQLLPLFEGQVYLRQLELDAPFVHLVRLPKGDFNLQHLFKPTATNKKPAANKQTSGGMALTPVVAKLVVRQGSLRFTDRSLTPAKTLSLTRIGFDAADVSLIAGKHFIYQAALDLPANGHITVDGQVTASPLSVSATLGVQHLSLKQGSPWLQQQTGLGIAGGNVAAKATLQLAGDNWRVSGNTQLSGLRLLGKQGKPLLAINHLSLDDVAVKQRQHRLEGKARLALKSVRFNAPDGKPLLAVDAASLDDVALTQQPHKLDAKGELALKSVQLEAANGKPLIAVKALTTSQLHVQQAGKSRQASGALEIDGWQVFDDQHRPLSGFDKLQLSDARLEQQADDLQVSAKLGLDNWHLEGANAKPLATLAKLTVSQFALRQQAQALTVSGGVSLDNGQWLSRNGKPKLSFASLAASGFKLKANQHVIDLKKLVLNGLDGGFRIRADGKTSVDRQQARLAAVRKRLPSFKRELAAAGVAPGGKSKPVNWQFRLGAFNLKARQLQLLDESVQPNYQLKAAPLMLTLGPLDSRGKPAKLKLTTQLGGYAPLTVKGTLSPFGKSLKADLAVNLKGYDMTNLSPYSGRYVAHLIDKGQLGIASKVTLNGSLLSSHSQIDARHFYLGKGVPSKQAIHAPVGFGLSILRDRHGNIGLPLTVAGDLNDPSVSVHGLILQALLNVLTRAATAPLSLLSLLSGGVNLDHVTFNTGSPRLTPKQLQALAGVAKVLKQRPDLMLGLSGSTNKADAGFLNHKGASGKALARKLKALAKQRAHALKLALVGHYKVGGERLYLEQPHTGGKVAGVVLGAVKN